MMIREALETKIIRMEYERKTNQEAWLLKHDCMGIAETMLMIDCVETNVKRPLDTALKNHIKNN